MSHANRYIRVYLRLYLYMQTRCKPWPFYPPCRVFACVLTLVEHSQIRALYFNLVSHTCNTLYATVGCLGHVLSVCGMLVSMQTHCRPWLLHTTLPSASITVDLGRTQPDPRAVLLLRVTNGSTLYANGGCLSHVLSVCCMLKA